MTEDEMNQWAKRECRTANALMVLIIVYTAAVCFAILKGWI